MEPVECERREPGVQRNHSSSLYGFATGWQLVLRLTRSSVLGWWLLLVQGHRSRSPRPRLWCARDVLVGGRGGVWCGQPCDWLAPVCPPCPSSFRMPRPSLGIAFLQRLAVHLGTSSLLFLSLRFPQKKPFTARLQGTFLFKTHGNVSPVAGVCGASCRHVCSKALGCSHAGSGWQESEGLSPCGWSLWTWDSLCPSLAGVAPVSPFFSAACEDTMAHRWLPLGLACLWQPARVGMSSRA